MVFLLYNLNDLEKRFKWTQGEKEFKLVELVKAAKNLGIEHMRYFDVEGKMIMDHIDFHSPYVEVNLQNLTFAVRKLTKESAEFQDKLEKKCNEIAMKKFNGSISTEPCNRCGNSPHSGYDGICLDCADELGISSEFFSDPVKYAKSLEKAEVFLDSFQNQVGTASFFVHLWGKSGLDKLKLKPESKEVAEKMIKDFNDNPRLNQNPFIKNAMRRLTEGGKN